MQKIKKPCINTGEFAHMCQTSKRTLFYYDEIGLFSPAYTDEKGYRYYSETQCDVFFTICCLREIGMPLKEIRAYIQNRNPKDLKGLLMEQQGKVQKDMERLKRIEQVICTKLQLVEQGQQLRNSRIFDDSSCSQVQEEWTEEEYLVISRPVFSENRETVMDILLNHIGRCNHQGLNAGHPYGAMMLAEDMKQKHWDRYAYFFNKQQVLPEGVSVHRKPKGHYAVVYLKGDYYDAEEAYQMIFSYLEKHGKGYGEYFYKEAVIDEIAVDSENEFITKISLQIL